ncbi:hypothetical protein H5410_014533 [Solanum commersonii]|uniref:Uncharacterized protein n=1 Tax=Solanum commersonii TaxID=4109 RepID=A0A9J5ZR54_SOLCO|nr:hypothetical protein H5410_014533 [Solanum commersonii]
MSIESWCTPEYYTWFMVGGILARPRFKGILGFTNTQRSNQIGTKLLNPMHITTTMYQQVTPRSIDHLIHTVDDEPNEEMEEGPKEDPREPTEEMEEDPEEYSKHDPNLYDPRDGGVMHIEDEHVPTAEDAHLKYGFIGNGKLTNPQSINRGLTIIWETMMMPQPGRRSSFFFEFPHKLFKVSCGLSLLYALWPPRYFHFFDF